eukprot:TRINITY_DN104314_c0_g1_i1.p1 TRINITY_DN104314_c0_g1~~TRINITY_DN104314_c0_g1_i1.p1  ORF type:complete len:509 (-),score=90.53 TRINITY_DN104314_c0_g1_i1:677-2203(-)
MSVPMQPSFDASRRFSEAESYAFCDSNVTGLPILHASEGFKKLFGFEGAGCVGKSYDKFIECQSLLARHPEAVHGAAHGVLQDEGIAAALDFLDSMTSSFVRASAEGRAQSHDSVLTLGCNCSGELFVYEMAFSILQHPSMGWSYAVALQRDVSGQVPVLRLCESASKGYEDYATILLKLKRGGPSLAECFNDSAVLAWLHRTMKFEWSKVLAQKLEIVPKDERQSARMAGRSVTSVSTSYPSHAPMDSAPPTSYTWSLAGALKQSSQSDPYSVSLRDGRFNDLLENLGEDEGDIPSVALPSKSNGCLEQLSLVAGSQVHEGLCFDNLRDLSFPFILADPSKTGSPIVFCSSGFLKLMGCSHSDFLGLGLQSLLEDWPMEDAAELHLQRTVLQDLCAAANGGVYYEPSAEIPRGTSTAGEVLVTSTIRASAQRFDCLAHIKQVELDDKMFLVGVLLELPGDLNAKTKTRTEQKLGDRVDAAIEALAEIFFFMAPMRRQFNKSPESIAF